MLHPSVIPWFTPADWEKARAVHADPDSMGSSYDAWLKASEQAAKLMESPAVTVHKVYLNADQLLAYAKRNNCAINADARVLCAIDVFLGPAFSQTI
jgi:hypothetical protein